MVGDQEGADGRFETSASELLDAIGEADSPATGGRPLIEEFRHGAWQVASLPASAGSDWTDLYGLAVTRNGTVWAVGIYDNGGSELPLIERR